MAKTTPHFDEVVANAEEWDYITVAEGSVGPRGAIGLYNNGAEGECIEVDLFSTFNVVKMVVGDDNGEVHVHGQDVFLNDFCCPECHNEKLYNEKAEDRYCPVCER